MSDVYPIWQWGLYVITNDRLHPGRPHLDITQAAIQGGADAIQLRDKRASSGKLYHLALELRQHTRKAGVAFIVNDQLDIALSVDADGLHVGQDDLPVKIARRYLGQGKILGASVGSAAEAQKAQKDGADYLGVGPIFEARVTKPDAGMPHGLDLLSSIRRVCHLPLIAIGGIQDNNVAAVIQAGAACAAVISAVVCAPDMVKAVRQLRKTIVDKQIALLDKDGPIQENFYYEEDVDYSRI